ncbi:MAG: serine/threonine protein kinase [Deltaproteobacteria bacterium]|nr:serine/threonine protein kinase [Deltaproteobacteria bacterium]
MAPLEQTPSLRALDTSGDPKQRYQIVGRIAAGGMAEIYLARMKSNAGVNREVVLKRLLPELQSNKEFVQMFRDEARIAAALNHPGIVQIFELGELDGSMFIAMELLKGINLRDLLARVYSKRRALPIPHVVRIACSCLEALEYAHAFSDPRGKKLNVVHRDVSPQNIIVTYEGTVKLVDFGVAKAEGRLHQTAAGMVKGKFAYMAPEQITGGRVDGRADLFALAEVIYEILLRRHPFYAPSDVQVLRAIIEKEPPHPADVDPTFPRRLGDILLRAMQKHRDARFRDAAEMHDALEEYLKLEKTPSTSIAVGRYVREVFADRIDAEQFARESGDDAQLIEVLTAGQAEAVAVLDDDGVKLMHNRRSSTAEPLETIAASDEEAPTQGGVKQSPRKNPPPRQLSEKPEDEMPTMMGALTPEERAELAVPVSLPRVEIVKPRTSAAPPPKPNPRPSAPPPPRTASEGETNDDDRPDPSAKLGAVPNSALGNAPTKTNAPASDFKNRVGFWLFITGVIAFVLALLAAGVLLTRNAESHELSVESEPPGAAP